MWIDLLLNIRCSRLSEHPQRERSKFKEETRNDRSVPFVGFQGDHKAKHSIYNLIFHPDIFIFPEESSLEELIEENKRGKGQRSIVSFDLKIFVSPRRSFFKKFLHQQTILSFIFSFFIFFAFQLRHLCWPILLHREIAEFHLYLWIRKSRNKHINMLSKVYFQSNLYRMIFRRINRGSRVNATNVINSNKELYSNCSMLDEFLLIYVNSTYISNRLQ